MSNQIIYRISGLQGLVTKSILFWMTLSGLILPGLISCRQTEKTEAITAEITAAQMEGRRAAGLLLGPEWKDTTQLKRALMDIKVKQSKYILAGKHESAAAFDSTFISTIRAVNPELARKLQ